jgi:hypothetical protein
MLTREFRALNWSGTASQSWTVGNANQVISRFIEGPPIRVNPCALRQMIAKRAKMADAPR